MVRFRSITLFKLMFKISPTITLFILLLFNGIVLQFCNLEVVLLELQSGCDIVPLFVYKFSISMVASGATVVATGETGII
ncbi:hypothetical protein SLEP1_g34901 [Rubroshorea leprosula]|uniref:Uncharacterized protein n=1 Tax=Rubroshorea leprosula TaxID=152421 RepID=A0AAV5KLW7_9ROSI|nr:hypothetical protein SLEP1_g34901 [Rubroshorea leprosula]